MPTKRSVEESIAKPGKARYRSIEGVRVDIEALRNLAHHCDPTRCRHAVSCCSVYEVEVDASETSRIVGAMPDAAKFAKGLVDDDAFVDPFEESDGECVLSTDEAGRCVFAYGTREAPVLCSLHSAAVELGLSPTSVKPRSCTLWPLFMVETDAPVLSVQEDALDFPCNTARQGHPTTLDPGVADIVRALFGPEFLRMIEQAM